LNVILICYRYSNIFESFHIFKGFVSRIMILSCIQVIDMNIYLVFPVLISRLPSLLAFNRFSVWYLCFCPRNYYEHHTVQKLPSPLSIKFNDYSVTTGGCTCSHGEPGEHKHFNSVDKIVFDYLIIERWY